MEREKVINVKNIVNEKHCLQIPINSSPGLLWENIKKLITTLNIKMKKSHCNI